MLENLLCAAIAVFAVWGVMTFVYVLLIGLIRPKQGNASVILLHLQGEAEAAVTRVSYCLTKLTVTGALRYTMIAAVYDDADLTMAEALQAAFGKDTHVLICSKSYFKTHFPA